MLSPLMFLHWFFSVEFLMANVAFKRTVIAVRPFMYLNIDEEGAKLDLNSEFSRCKFYVPLGFLFECIVSRIGYTHTVFLQYE